MNQSTIIRPEIVAQSGIMQAMTPEQNEAWKEAVLPVAKRLSDEQWQAERTLLSLLPMAEQKKRFAPMLGEERLRFRGMPYWVKDLRQTLLTWRSDHIIEPWIGRFVLRSEAAMVGIQIANPEGFYQGLFVRFVQEALLPFVEWARQVKGARRSCYHHLLNLYYLCEVLTVPADPAPLQRLYLSFGRDGENSGTLEKRRAVALTRDLITGLVIGLRVEDVVPTALRFTWHARYTVHAFNRQHQWRLEGKEGEDYSDGANYTELIASAFLNALESECPPPDWLELGHP